MATATLGLLRQVTILTGLQDELDFDLVDPVILSTPSVKPAMSRRLFRLIVVVASVAPTYGFAEEGSRLPAFSVASCLVHPLAFAPDDGWGPNGLTVVGQVVFLAGGQSVEAIDVSRPEKPVKLASQRFATELKNANPRYAGGGDSGHDLVYRDGYLYVTGQNDHCLLILRVESKQIRDLADG